MKIVSYLDNENEGIKLFRRLKRKTKGSWEFLLSGEWSQSPYHQGNVKFFVRSSDGNYNWVLLSHGFPERIVVTASFDEPTSLEDASVSMLKYLRKRGGDYFEFIHEMGKIDEDKFWKAYEK